MGQVVVRDLWIKLARKLWRRLAMASQAHHQRRAEEAAQALHHHARRARDWRNEGCAVDAAMNAGDATPGHGEDRDETREDTIR
jgi:predicted translin family RNA/ssDNA-binding protein